MASIFDLSRLDRNELVRRARAALAHFAPLRRIYSDEFVGRLSRRATSANYLLWLLVEGAGDGRAAPFWEEITSNLDLLGDRGWQRFGGPLRRLSREDIEAARTEIDLAAKFLRAGITIDFPPDEDGRHYEFAANTEPRTYWEVKTVADIARVRRSNDVLHQLQTRLHGLKHPFMINVEEVAVDEEVDIHATIRKIREHIIALHRGGHALPYRFEVAGVVVAVKKRRSPGDGYVGMMEQGFVFENEGSERIRDKIRSAVPQLPQDGAGIVVIDASTADWLDVDDLKDACFGTSNRFIIDGARAVPVLNDDGVFSPHRCRRVSAVAYYNRRFTDSDRYPQFDIFLNPLARTPLSATTLSMLGARQFALTSVGNGLCRIKQL